ncbi:MAG: hypothetical protein SGPRY_008909, partial [Prymnesium sp.]
MAPMGLCSFPMRSPVPAHLHSTLAFQEGSLRCSASQPLLVNHLCHISPILLHQALVSAKAVDLNVLLEEKCPKKFLFPLLTLLWATFSSYTTLALTMA